jgi:hypothetical protein
MERVKGIPLEFGETMVLHREGGQEPQTVSRFLEKMDLYLIKFRGLIWEGSSCYFLILFMLSLYACNHQNSKHKPSENLMGPI